MNNSNIDKLGKTYNRWALIIILAGFVLIILLPWLFSQHYWKFSFTETGQIGDTIGGITAPVIGFMSAILIYISFMIQYRANQIQWSAIRDEQLLNRLPSSINEIKMILESDKTEKGMSRIKFFSSHLTTLAKNDYQHSEKVFFDYKSAFDNLTIYLNKIPLLIQQISNSGISDPLKNDFFLDMINLDNDLYDTLYKLNYDLTQVFSESFDISKYRYFKNGNVKKTKVLHIRLGLYVEEITKIRQKLL